MIETKVVERHCKAGCGAVVWSYLETTPHPPRVTETILCPNCGVDNSIAPSLGQRWQNALECWHHWRAVYGWLWWFYNPPWKGFFLEREQERQNGAV